MPRRTILTFVCLLPACAGLGSGPHKTGGTGDADGDAATSLASSYSLINHFSITAASQAPQPAYEILLALDADPGRALLALADAGGVPAAEQLFDALPSSLANRLGGWMTDAIGGDGIDEAQTLMQWSRFILADVEVHSSLEIDAINASGEGAATHILDSLVFHVGDDVVEEEIPQIPSRPGAGHAELTVQKTPGSGTLEIGSHRFGLLFGHAAYQAFESMVLARYGTDVRGLLGQAIDCPAVADDVANRCVLGVCVGHRSMLVDLCDGALDQAAQEIREQFDVFDAEVLRLSRGDVTIRSSLDGSELIDGTWVAEAELGQGLRSLPARFAGNSY